MNSGPPSSVGGDIEQDLAVVRALLKNDLFAGVRTQKEFNALFARAVETVPKPYALLLFRLLGYDPLMKEDKAKRFWGDIISHRADLVAKLGRPVHLRVAAMDLISSGKGPDALGFPILIGSKLLRRLVRALDRSTRPGDE
jgi:hypothetical protein